MKSSLDKKKSSKGLWPVLLEEELRTLSYYQPVLGLPDTLKAKLLIPFREKIISYLLEAHKEHIELYEYDFNAALDSFNLSSKKGWKPLREGVSTDLTLYPCIEIQKISECRTYIRKEINPMIKGSFPSLAETDKPDPSDEWIPDLES